MKQITVKTQHQLRNWFEKNHAKESKVFLISWKKHTGKAFLTPRQQMDEAICFGWIDTTVKRIDENRYGRHFVKRTKTGKWSTNTITYAKQLIKEERMTSCGLKAYKQGLKNPVHDSRAGKKATIPQELKEALGKNKNAKEHFALYPPSTKKVFYSWISNAKRPETKEKRIRETLELAVKKQKPFTKDK